MQVGKENVRTALSLVGYKAELQPAMEYVFGNSFVCKDMDAAKRVTFEERINKKSVTLDGDSFDPAGTLTGGSMSISVLMTQNHLLSLEAIFHVTWISLFFGRSVGRSLKMICNDFFTKLIKSSF